MVKHFKIYKDPPFWCYLELYKNNNLWDIGLKFPFHKNLYLFENRNLYLLFLILINSFVFNKYKKTYNYKYNKLAKKENKLIKKLFKE